MIHIYFPHIERLRRDFHTSYDYLDVDGAEIYELPRTEEVKSSSFRCTAMLQYSLSMFVH